MHIGTLPVELDRIQNPGARWFASAERGRLLSGGVLLVESDPDVRFELRYHLARLGVVAEVARDVSEAIDRAEQGSFDVILMGVPSPKLVGLEGVRRLREQGYTRPIVALSAVSDETIEEAIREAGFDALLARPFTLERLAAVLGRFLTNEGQPVEGESPTRDDALVSNFADDPAFLPLVWEYVDSLTDRVEELRRAVTDGNLDEAARIAHIVRGSGGMYGYPELSELASLIEDAARERREADLIGELLAELDVLVDRMHRGLHE